MADFKAMMAAKNKKHSPVDDIKKVEENRDAIEKVEEIREEKEVKETAPLISSTDKPDQSIEQSQKVENLGDGLTAETGKVEKIRDEKEVSKANTTISSGKTKRNTTSKSKKVEKSRGLTEEAPLNLSTFENGTLISSTFKSEQSKEPEKAQSSGVQFNEQAPLKKTNLSMSKTSVNYIRMNSKRQRINQTDYFKSIVLEMIDLKSKEEVTKALSYDNFELRKRHVIDSTPLNVILPEDILEWLRNEAADNCISMSQLLDEFIQEKIHKELEVNR